MKRIGFIGLGIMGSGMVKNLVRKGWSVSVWNRSAERAQQFGLPVAASRRELAAHSDVVVCCVSDPHAVERVVFGEDGVIHAARSGFCYVECSTVSPELLVSMRGSVSGKPKSWRERAYLSRPGINNPWVSQ